MVKAKVRSVVSELETVVVSPGHKRAVVCVEEET
jgi:hypothetical protein